MPRKPKPIPPKPVRGFAAMPPERQRELASIGGRSVPAESRSFSRDPELARRAGRKGGLAVPDEKRQFFRDHELAVIAGKKGGLARTKKG